MKTPSPRPAYLVSLVSVSFLLLCCSMADPTEEEALLKCLMSHSEPSISDLTFFPANTSYATTLQSYIRNLRFSSATTPKPLLIVTPTRVSHVRATVLCARAHRLHLRIRSGGHDYDGLSYVSPTPFLLLDMFNLRSIHVSVPDETAWVQSGATIGELYYRIAQQSSVHGFPAGVCPTVGVGGHLSGGGYGNMMRKHGLSVDNVVDAEVVDADGSLLNRASMGEDLFWAIRGGGGASFAVIVSWKIKLVRVPETVTVFNVERTLEQGLTDTVHRWQFLSETAPPELFIRIVLMPVNRKAGQNIKGKFVALFLGPRSHLLEFMNLDSNLPQLGLKSEECIEMGWIESVLFWSNYPAGTSADVLLERIPKSEKFLKRKSDYVGEAIESSDLEQIWKKMMELKKVKMAWNLYGGKMGEIGEGETPFPHREGNRFKIQYSVNWKEEEATESNLEQIRKLREYMTGYVSKSPRGAYLNYRDVELGVNGDGYGYEEARVWGEMYFKGNFERLVEVKTNVDPTNFFRYQQSIPSLPNWNNTRATDQ